MCGKKIVTLKNEETACLGSAILAGVAIGVFESVEAACKKAVAINKSYSPNKDVDYTDCYNKFKTLEDSINS
jgi:xylulokinase